MTPQFSDIIKRFPSYRDAAQNFEGVTRKCMKSWVNRNWIPEKHWNELEVCCKELGLPYDREDFRAWARATGKKLSYQQYSEIANIDWFNMYQSLVKFSWKKKWTSDEWLVHEAAMFVVVDMMNRGKSSFNYGLSAIRHYLASEYKRRNRYCEIPEEWKLYSAGIASPSMQENKVFVSEVLDAIEDMSERLKGVARLMIEEAENKEIAKYLGVGVQSVGSYKSDVRRYLCDKLEMNKFEARV